MTATPTAPLASPERSHQAQSRRLHPTRTAPLCATCAHHRAGNCDHPAAPVSIVNGAPLLTAEMMRSRRGVVFDGECAETCGPGGRYHQPVDMPPTCRTCNGAGSYRAPYSRVATACPDCLTRPISTATATTSAAPQPAGSKA